MSIILAQLLNNNCWFKNVKSVFKILLFAQTGSFRTNIYLKSEFQLYSYNISVIYGAQNSEIPNKKKDFKVVKLINSLQTQSLTFHSRFEN